MMNHYESNSSIPIRQKPVRELHTSIWAVVGFAFILLSVACLAVTIGSLVRTIDGIATTGPVQYFIELFLFLGVCAIFGFGGYRLIKRGIVVSTQMAAFDKANTTTEAKVLRRHVEHVVRFDDEYDEYSVVVQFETDSGQFSLKAFVHKAIFDRMSPDKSVSVRYANSDPTVVLFEGESFSLDLSSWR